MELFIRPSMKAWIELFKKQDIVHRLIVINTGFFLLQKLLILFGNALSAEEYIYAFNRYFYLSSDSRTLLYKPLSLISYGFTHAHIWHLIFNMLILFFAGKTLQRFIGENRVLTLYLIGTLAGGFFFLLFMPLIPGITQQNYLMGSSAGVIAILTALIFYDPRMPIFLFPLGIIPLKYLGILYLIIELASFFDGNEGGHLSHLGGALVGWYYIKRSSMFVLSLHPLLHIFRNKKKFRKSGISYYAEEYSAKQSFQKYDQKKVDAILDKISRSGYESLTKEEKEYLFKVSNK